MGDHDEDDLGNIFSDNELVSTVREGRDVDNSEERDDDEEVAMAATAAAVAAAAATLVG